MQRHDIEIAGRTRKKLSRKVKLMKAYLISRMMPTSTKCERRLLALINFQLYLYICSMLFLCKRNVSYFVKLRQELYMSLLNFDKLRWNSYITFKFLVNMSLTFMNILLDMNTVKHHMVAG